MSENLDQIVQGKAQKWLDGNYDSKTKDQVKYLMENDKKELTESFYKDLEFGTGGLRGIMGVGTNRMNVYTVGMATQGLANYLKKAFPGKQIKVAIGPQQQPALFRTGRIDFRSQRIQGIPVRFATSDPGTQFRDPAVGMPERGSNHGIAQPQGIQRLQGILGRRSAGNPSAR